MKTIATALLILLLPPAIVEGQRVDRRFASQDTARPAPHQPLIRIGKWAMLGAAGGAAAWAISINGEADRRYDDLEQLCEATPSRCRRSSTDGPFIDNGLEQEYQDILDLDRRAERVLLAAQASILSSLALFILDLPRDTSTEPIPYKPPRLERGPFRLWLIPQVVRR